MIFDPILDLFRGKAVTIPPLDGAFRPNTVLDEANVVASLSEVDNLVVRQGQILASSCNAVFSIGEAREPLVVETFPTPVTALAVSRSGELAVALATGKLLIDGRDVDLPASIRCITAIAFDGKGALWLANGSARQPVSGWAADLMTKGASGSLWKREADGSTFREIAAGLGFPYGLFPGAGSVLISESWRHRLLDVDDSGRQNVIVDHLPGYPARLSPAPNGGAWLAIFAPRNRLIEFVLQEEHYRSDMIASVQSSCWIAPSLSSGRSFLEPLQCGGIRSMGVHKPWSPSRSYGMVVKLDARLQPVTSVHSRANGDRHGTTSVIEHDGKLLVASKGGDCVLSVDLEQF